MNKQKKQGVRGALLNVLPEVLPTNPKDAMKGDEVMRMVKGSIPLYAGPTVRAALSALAREMGTGVKSPQGKQGYYWDPDDGKLDRIEDMQSKYDELVNEFDERLSKLSAGIAALVEIIKLRKDATPTD